jgi:3',5'-cyclic-AMP phosphodiesterase
MKYHSINPIFYILTMTHRPLNTRREFIRNSAIMTAAVAAGFPAVADLVKPAPLRLVFATDIHLMQDNKLRSADGMAAALDAIQKVRPDLILCGGDLTDPSPNLDFPAAQKLLDQFFNIWNRHTSVETHYAFGNHDLVGTKNKAVCRTDPRFGKGLYQKHLGLSRLYYSFEKRGWRFIVLDDVWPNPDGTYYAEYKADQLNFLRCELEMHRTQPTVITAHIPSFSVFPTLAGYTKLNGTNLETAISLVSKNSRALFTTIHDSKANVKLVLAGHLHHQELIEVEDIHYLNGGAICGNWWKGSVMGTSEGFNQIDLHPDGTFDIVYQTYGWKAVG